LEWTSSVDFVFSLLVKNITFQTLSSVQNCSNCEQDIVHLKQENQLFINMHTD